MHFKINFSINSFDSQTQAFLCEIINDEPQKFSSYTDFINIIFWTLDLNSWWNKQKLDLNEQTIFFLQCLSKILFIEFLCNILIFELNINNASGVTNRIQSTEYQIETYFYQGFYYE